MIHPRGTLLTPKKDEIDQKKSKIGQVFTLGK